MKLKTSPAKVKAAGDADGLNEGEFKAIVSVFGNIDSVGDVVVPGAFTDTLTEWAAKGDPIPVIWAHDWRDPFSHLGSVLDAVEVEGGLFVHGQLDLDNEKAAQVYRLLKGRRVTQFSFAYDVLEGAWVEADNESFYELRKLALHEVGPCLLGANQETELLAVKAHDLVARLNRGDTTIDLDQLAGAHAALGQLIEAAKSTSPEEDTNPSPEAGQPDPDAANDPTGVSGSSAEQHQKVSPAQVTAWTTVNQLQEVAR